MEEGGREREKLWRSTSIMLRINIYYVYIQE